ncbi:hypothetical protein CC1G_15423 [Coprinopsis cinerea okayama7|uniref:V-SNARE coiled-coil homology domain-containing protein n=1 Tax=Coprinopsis cinerea (strain Okayama-7 / 130 / ATCC MYA-4618 / FGSC 9003) TaxID=240176 RepID=D6RQT8_COPC7|nr:hypothetical protein CC1G_15423 [Coprinopsis cinerea okayama7\|eukprot:XP_002910146.1 hypothetical protein CC1G_15423 [Coprinopsis cinerea okayama7\
MLSHGVEWRCKVVVVSTASNQTWTVTTTAIAIATKPLNCALLPHNLHSNLSINSTMSEPYDPYLPRAGSSSGNPGSTGGGAGNAKTAAIQAQIDDTVGIMRENITKVAERGERLDSLQDKTDNLAVSAQGFRRGANRVRKNMW